MPFDDAGFGQRESDLAVLRVARDGLARPGGWCQDAVGHLSAHCAVGWLMTALGNKAYGASEADFVARTLSVPGSRMMPLARLVNYNDAEGRTQAEMVAVFDEAIARLEAGG